MAVIGRTGLERALDDVEARLGKGPSSLDLEAERAQLLARLGRTEEARARYLEILQRDPTHFATLNNFGTLLYETDYRSAARTVFEQAVRHHPQQPMGHVNLANLLMYAGELETARGHYETALSLDPANAHAHQRFSALLHELGEPEAMQRHRRLGFGAAPMQSFPCLGPGEGIPLLLLTSTPAGDIAWRKLVDDQRFQTTALAAEFHDPSASLPAHRLVFNAIGDADLCREDLLAAQALCDRSVMPVINPPANVLETRRMDNARRLGGLPGVRAPRVALMRGEAISADALAAEGFGFPLLLRSPGFHTGRHFVRVDAAEALDATVAALPGPELMAIEHLDARGPDGFARKYRVMMIDGRLYPLHLAASPDWKVHYFTGAMGDREDFRDEEARFLEQMPQALGPRAMEALAAIQETMGLDYAGVDFALGPEGELLLFEANATMNIIAPDASARWDYRRAAIAAALAATREMLVRRARL